MNSIKIIKQTINYWYFSLLAGILLVGVGLWAIIFPRHSIIAVAIVFALTFLIVGLFETVFAISNREGMINWGWGLALGIINLLIGILLLAHPGISALTLAFYVGFVILFQSIGAIIISFDLKNYRILQWGNLLAMGILGLIFAFLLLLNPNFTNVVIVIFLGLSLIIDGVISVYSSLKLKKIKSKANKFSSDLTSRYEALEKEIEDIFKED